MTSFAGRVLVNALVGGLISSIAGAFCLILFSIFGDWLFNLLPGALMLGGEQEDIMLSIILGVVLGGIPGVFIYGIAAFKAKPTPFFAPLRWLTKRVVIGQIVGTLIACFSYLIFTFIVAQTQTQSFLTTVGDNFNLLPLSTFVLLVCGAIAAALTQRDLPQSATLKAE